MSVKKNTKNGCPIKKSIKYLWKMKRQYKILLLVFLMIIGGGYFFMQTDWQSIVRSVVHKYGSQAIGTEVNVGNIELSLLSGKGSVNKISVANPQGYSADNIIYLGNISIDVDTKSLTKPTIIINEIGIDNPEVTYEILNFSRNNIKEILDNLNKNNTSQTINKKQDKNKVTNDDSVENKKVAIKRVIIRSGKVNVVSDLIGTQSMSVPLPTITLKNIGSAKKGVSIEEGISRIFKQIFYSTTHVISKIDLESTINSAGEVVGATANETVKIVGGVAENAGETARGVAKGVENNVKGLANGVSNLWK